MCIAIMCPAGVRPTKAVLRQCFENNPDGAGYAYGNGKAVVIRKGFYTWRSFWEDFRAHAPKDDPVMIHFRIATSGKINGENCHPFRIDNKHAMIHNGNLAGKIGLSCENISDTALFVGNILRPTIQRSDSIWKTKAFRFLMEESIGFSNKCVILGAQGEFVIFHEKQGNWHNGVWFSNRSYTAEKVHRPTSSTGSENFNNGIAICTATFAKPKDIVNSEPNVFFWTRRAQDAKVTTKRAAFYSKMQQSNANAASGKQPDTVQIKALNKTTESTTNSSAGFSRRDWSKIA